jgi:hypothetical protein
VHWHVAPLPRGVPFDELAALDSNRVLDLREDEMAELAARICQAIEETT